MCPRARPAQVIIATNLNWGSAPFGTQSRSKQEEAAGRERVATRGRGPCRPTVLLPPPVTPSYHKKVTSVSNFKAGHERRRQVLVGFRYTPLMLQFPRRPLLGSWVNR